MIKMARTKAQNREIQAFFLGMKYESPHSVPNETYYLHPDFAPPSRAADFYEHVAISAARMMGVGIEEGEVNRLVGIAIRRAESRGLTNTADALRKDFDIEAPLMAARRDPSERDTIPANPDTGAYRSISELTQALCFNTGQTVMLSNKTDKDAIRRDVVDATGGLDPRTRQTFLVELERLLNEL